jgi:hypothetical protein
VIPDAFGVGCPVTGVADVEIDSHNVSEST